MKSCCKYQSVNNNNSDAGKVRGVPRVYRGTRGSVLIRDTCRAIDLLAEHSSGVESLLLPVILLHCAQADDPIRIAFLFVTVSNPMSRNL